MSRDGRNRLAARLQPASQGVPKRTEEAIAMSVETCRAKAREIERQAKAPMTAANRDGFRAQARYLRDHADRLERDLRSLEQDVQAA